VCVVSIEFFPLNISDRQEMLRVRDIDVGMCRNAFIYFDDTSRRAALASVVECLVPGGFVLLGYAENMERMSSARNANGPFCAEGFGRESLMIRAFRPRLAADRSLRTARR